MSVNVEIEKSIQNEGRTSAPLEELGKWSPRINGHIRLGQRVNKVSLQQIHGAQSTLTLARECSMAMVPHALDI